MPVTLPPDLADRFRTFGFAVLRGFFDPGPLEAEVDRVLHHGPGADLVRSGEIRFQYVPMMTTETPVSLELLDGAEAVAAALLGGSVIPTRAKTVRYVGDTPWHTDSDLPIATLGFLAYLEPNTADTGALRVLPGSHLPAFADALRDLEATGRPAPALPAHVVETRPGDLILLDEHLFHSSCGGGIRRQWRVDFLRVPADLEAEAQTRAYYAGIFPPDWDGGYDVDRYPSYGPDWRSSGRAAVAHLEALGVYDLAAVQEAFTRSRRHPASSRQPPPG